MALRQTSEHLARVPLLAGLPEGERRPTATSVVHVDATIARRSAGA